MVGEILSFAGGAVFGGIASLVLRAWNDKRNQSRVGSDNNVIKEVADGITDVKSAVGAIQGGIEAAAGTAGEVRDASTALADVIRRIEERERKP